ncbi:hypothetical protein E0Z10_g4551 [Xylaria hypoxylon]|uniref:RRM domain-containing protein n=1 Tax=Xylaria hypoxylon TaxID=37992 RepID=A0A4Z0YWA3_9PEZI|nr:hypothetical protein E0Z10_g4551 [Xylaria hypoxylon]
MADQHDIQSWIKTCKKSWMNAGAEEGSDHEKEEPKHEEPKHEEPKHEEPKHEEPKHEEPKHEEPKHENGSSYYPNRYLKQKDSSDPGPIYDHESSDYQKEYPKHHSSDPGLIYNQEDSNHNHESSKHDHESSKHDHESSNHNHKSSNHNHKSSEHDQEIIQQASAEGRGIQHPPDSILPHNVSERPKRRRGPELRVETNVLPVFVPRRVSEQPHEPSQAVILPVIANGITHVPRAAYQFMLDDGRNASVYIMGLPREIKYPALLESLTGLGKIYQTQIIPPKPPNVFAAAKVTFWYRDGVDRLHSKNGEGRFNFGGNYNPTIMPSRYWNPSQDPSVKSRVVIITGPPVVVNYPNLSTYFQYRGIHFRIEKVETRQDWNTGLPTMRWCFVSFRYQADMVYETLCEAVRGSRGSYNIVDIAWAATRVSWG